MIARKNIFLIFLFIVLVSALDLSTGRDKFLNSLKDTDFLENSTPPSTDLCKDNKDKPKFFQFLPVIKAILKFEGASQTFTNGCFREVTATLTQFTKESTVVTFESENPVEFFCKDSYLVTTSNIHDTKFILMKGKSTFTLKNLTDEDMLEIKINGLRIFSFCDSFAPSMVSLYKTIQLFFDYQKMTMDDELTDEKNIKFLETWAGCKHIPRGAFADIILPIDENIFQTGDLLGVYKISGLGSLILYLTGARLSHMTMAFRIDGQLFVLESEIRGIVRTPYQEWVQKHHERGYSVIHLPLKEEVRKKFNADSALKWFKSVEGLNYGYHNFLFSWFDTVNGNMSQFASSEVLLLAFSIADKIKKDAIHEYVLEALNLRVGENTNSIHEVTLAANRKGMTFEELMALPEQDDWEYSDGQNFTCSCFVMGIYKASGIFNFPINAKEFTPKDVYILDIFDKEFKNRRPKLCVAADPELDYCQIAGKYKVPLEGYSTLHAYPNMSERCSTAPPFYMREEYC